MAGTKTQKNDSHDFINDLPIDDLEMARNKLEQHFNELHHQAESTTNVWERYEISILLKELKYIYEEILKGGK